MAKESKHKIDLTDPVTVQAIKASAEQLIHDTSDYNLMVSLLAVSRALSCLFDTMIGNNIDNLTPTNNWKWRMKA
jgi:hypothetical protein